jgi:hypothetical protein
MSRLDEKRFTALGVEWIARFDFNATCAIEEKTGKGFYEFVGPLLVKLDAEDAKDTAKVFSAIKGIRQSDIRLVLFHALSDAHDVTIEDVGKIIQDIGTAEAMAIMAWAIVQAMPTAADAGETEGNAKPPATGNRRQRKAAAKIG